MVVVAVGRVVFDFDRPQVKQERTVEPAGRVSLERKRD